MGLLLGIDVGTTNTKAVLYDPALGGVAAVSSRPTVTHHSRPGRSEFDAAEIWQGVVEAIRQTVGTRGTDVKAVAIASFAEAGAPIDAQGNYLYPIIAWHDPRSEPQTHLWRQWLGTEGVYEITGHPIQFKYTAAKLLWLKEHEPDVFARLYKWLCAEDFVIWKMTGEFATDYTIASRTMLFDQRSKSWSKPMLEMIGIDSSVFPKPHQSGTQVGQLSDAAAEATGLRAGLPVVTGGHDHLCGALAAGITGPGALLNSLGTAEACLVLTESFRPNAHLANGGYSHYAYTAPNLFVLHFGLTASGGMLEWLVRQLEPMVATDPAVRRSTFNTLIDEAAAVPAGSQGLVWLPHLNGVASPWTDEQSRACAVGYGPGHGRGHSVRALLESLCYWMRENLEGLTQVADLPADAPITAIGGGSTNELWMQIKADVTGRPVRVVEVPEAVAVGAALLAGVGSGHFANYEEAAGTVNRSGNKVYEANKALKSTYEEGFGIYRSLYPALREINHRIHKLNQESKAAEGAG